MVPLSATRLNAATNGATSCKSAIVRQGVDEVGWGELGVGEVMKVDELVD